MSLDTMSFGFVRDIVRQDSAIVLDDDKSYLVESRLLPLARRAGTTDVSTFVRQIRTNLSPAMRRDVVEALTTNETSFFRDGEPFRVLSRTVLPDLIRARPSKTLSVWSAACSSGQEAYSIAMTAKDDPQFSSLEMRIVGTDLSTQMVSRASEGFFTQLEISRGLPAAHMVKYFRREGTGWRVNPELRAMTKFQQMNLIQPFPPGMYFDIVFLRNVLIYFDASVKRQILSRVRAVMPTDGYLFLGAAESTLGIDDAWERVSTGRMSIYRPRKDLPR